MDFELVAGWHADEPQERADAAANRRLLLATAERLYAARGVENVTMADIAAEAGVGKGTLYRRFDNKAELTLALMDEQMSSFQNDALDRLRLQMIEGESALTQLESFLDALVTFTDFHLPLLCVVQSQGLVAEMREHTQPYHWQYQTVQGLLQRAQRWGEIGRSVDVDYTADALLAPMRADIFRFQRQARGFSVERISLALRALVSALRT